MTVSMITTLLLAIVGLDVQGMFPGVAEPAAYDEWTEPVYEQAYYEPEYYEPTYTPTYYGDPNDFQTAGVVYEDGVTYTWYSQNVLPGGGLDIPGRTTNDEGYVCDGSGNICVASSDYEIGTQLETPFGDAVVYDTGCASGVVDVYTGW